MKEGRKGTKEERGAFMKIWRSKFFGKILSGKAVGARGAGHRNAEFRLFSV